MGTEGFRANEINFLQQQNNIALASLENAETERDNARDIIRDWEEKDVAFQSELTSIRDRVDTFNGRVQQNKAETIAKDEHVRVLSEQNRQMLDLLETEETKAREKAEQILLLEDGNLKLRRIRDAFDEAKAAIEAQVAEAKQRVAELFSEVKNTRNLNENLRANIQNTEAKTKVDIESLGQALAVVDNKNIEYLHRINKQESKEQQLKSETETLKEEVEKVREEINALRREIEGDEDGRSTFERSRSSVEQQIEALEVQADTLKKALNTAERANEQIQEENRTAGERCRETADKIYALMDSLRLNQVELKKQEAENGARDKKLLTLERQTQNLQAKISMETDAKAIAEQERKEAEQESMVLKKKNRKVEDAVTQSQQEQEKAEKAISELNEKVSALQTQNAYLASRIDGQEEEKNGLKAEMKKTADRLSDLTRENTRLRDGIEDFGDQMRTSEADKKQLLNELEFIKREDVLDEGGRTRPILIQSTESDLIEKLQINEFLYEAQQARNPVPPIIEKVAQLLSMLHEGQTRADQYLGNLQQSNGLVSALRQRNMLLFTKTQMFESFKTRALLKYVMNLVEADLAYELLLDGLSFGQREINEMLSLLQRYEATDKVFVVSLTENDLDDDCINLLLQLIFAFPYIRKLDLRQNAISEEGIKQFEAQMRMMEGITGVIRTADQVVNIHSGNQLRLCIDLSAQLPKGSRTGIPADFAVEQELAGHDADPFIASTKSIKQPWVAGQQAPPLPQQSPQIVETVLAVPEATSAQIRKPSANVGGPPIGLGGPGNVAQLGRKAGAKDSRLPAAGAKRQSRRSKAAPPPALDYMPHDRLLEKWQADKVPLEKAVRPLSAQRANSHRSNGSRHSDRSDKSGMRRSISQASGIDGRW